MNPWARRDHMRAWAYAALWSIMITAVALLKAWLHTGSLGTFIPQEFPTLLFALVSGIAMGYAIVSGKRSRRDRKGS